MLGNPNRQGNIEYGHLAAVIFNQIRSKDSFKLTTFMPWLETPPESQNEKRRISLFDMTLRHMIKDNLIYQIPSTGPGEGKRFAISPGCKGEQIEKLKNYTTLSMVNLDGYQMARAIFKSSNPTPPMVVILNNLESYLNGELGAGASSIVASPSVPSVPPITEMDGGESVSDHQNVHADMTNRPGDTPHGPSSVDSDATNGSITSEHVPFPTTNSYAPARSHSEYQTATPFSRGPILGNFAMQSSKMPGTENTLPTFPMSSATAGSKSFDGARDSSKPTPAPGTLESSPSTTYSQAASVPEFLLSGLARLREKYPDDEFEPSLDGRIWLIKCHDCQQKLYRPDQHGKNVVNFETHLKNRTHGHNVAVKLERLGRSPRITRDVSARLERCEVPNRREGKTSTPLPSITTERQYSALPSPSKSIDPATGNTLGLRSESIADADYRSSLMVTLGPCEGLKKRRSDETSHTEFSHSERSKRPRLSQNGSPLEITQKNEDAYARIETLEDLNQSLIESSRKQTEELDTRFQGLATAHQSLANTIETQGRKVMELDKLAHASTRVSRMHDGEIEGLKNSITAIARSFQEHDVQVQNVISKAMEMEQTIRELREICSKQKQRLETAAAVEKELKDRISMVQKLVLRQSETMKTASNEREETERRFARLEAIISNQSVENSSNGGWSDAFSTVIDRNSDAILQCQEESAHIMERVEALERGKDEQMNIISDLEAQLSPKSNRGESTVMTPRVRPRKAGSYPST